MGKMDRREGKSKFDWVRESGWSGRRRERDGHLSNQSIVCMHACSRRFLGGTRKSWIDHR